MGKGILLPAACALALLPFLTACTTEEFHFGYESAEESSSSSSGSTTSPTLPDSSSDLLDFTIELDDTDRTTYGEMSEMSETIVTDPDDESYEDFIENCTFSSVVTITYSGTTATVDNSVSGVTITQDGAHIVVNSTAQYVDYVLTGSTTNGSFKLASADYRSKVTLNGVSIHNPSGAAINIQTKKRTFIVSADDTENALTDGTSYSIPNNEDMKGCLFSEGQIIFSGGGSLSVTGNYRHAIACDQYIRFRSGCQVSVPSAVKDGIHANDSIIIGGGIVEVYSDDDGIQCEEGGLTMTGGFVYVSTSDDGADALKSAGELYMTGGAVQAEVTGRGSKGLYSATDINITGGKITVLTSGGALYEDADLSSCAGLKAAGNISISSVTLALQSTGISGKGINCDGNITLIDVTLQAITTGTTYTYGTLHSSAKGIRAEGNITIDGGTICVKATGGDSSEGIESKSAITINSGTIAALCYDDCINAATDITINDGYIYCYSSGNDGIDSNGTINIAGGVIVASGSTFPEESFDCDGSFIITGGTVVGTGGTTPTPTSSSAAQYSVLYTGTGTEGQIFHIETSDGSSVLTYMIPRTYSEMIVLFSSPNIASGTSYTIYTGGTVSDGSEFFGFYSGETYIAGTQVTTFTPSSKVTQVGSGSSSISPTDNKGNIVNNNFFH